MAAAAAAATAIEELTLVVRHSRDDKDEIDIWWNNLITTQAHSSARPLPYGAAILSKAAMALD